MIHQLIGLHSAFGSFLSMLVVIQTILKGFAIVSERMGKVTPILLTATILLSFYIIIKNYEGISFHQISKASPLASTWPLVGILFLTYNILGAIPILGSCAIHTESIKTAKKGAALGGILLGSCALILYFTVIGDASHLLPAI